MDLKDLYRDVIVDHNRSPRNFRKIDPPRRMAEGFNPLCGDKLHVYLRLDGDVIEDISFEGSGCAISVASASLMTETLKGKTAAQAQDYFACMHSLLTDGQVQCEDIASLGKLAALSGVREFPTRVKCATLCWHTMKNAIEGSDEAASTE
jgi:nitrogen fixation NifU-like protein